MNPITRYIKAHSNGLKFPITSKQLSVVFEVSGTEIRRLINEARSAGDCICSCSSGYYYSEDQNDLSKTIDSLRGRISKQEQAIAGLVSRI